MQRRPQLRMPVIFKRWFLLSNLAQHLRATLRTTEPKLTMPPPTRELAKSCRIYAHLMEEIKRRQDVIAQVLNHTTPLPEMAAFEFSYLQLRKICEVFALACLAAHGDIPEVRTQLQSAYNADKIMKQLTRIHPQFYPVPSKQTVDQVTKRPIEVQVFKYLTV
jgi:hypothetical protein